MGAAGVRLAAVLAAVPIYCAQDVPAAAAATGGQRCPRRRGCARRPEPVIRADRERRACQARILATDFALNRFQNSWTHPANMSAFADCLYRLRTTLRPTEKAVHAGGVHYPTLVVTNHQRPVVSTSGAAWCWLDRNAVAPSGLSAWHCCDKQNGPRGDESCWDNHFTYELCCLGDLTQGELPHFYSVPAFDLNVGNTVKKQGTFDLRMSYALQSLCRPGYRVLDVGANLGGFTVALAERVGPSGEVHAFEPFRKVFQHLNANVALNGLSNVHTYNVAVGREDKILDLHAPDLATFGAPSAMRVAEQHSPDEAAIYDKIAYERKRVRVPMRRLDSFEFDGPVHFIKIDVEYMELDVVLGARELILRERPVIWAENEPYFKSTPRDTTFVDTMASEYSYECQPMAELELLCTPKERTAEVIGSTLGIFAPLNAPLHYISLQRVLAAADPNFPM